MILSEDQVQKVAISKHQHLVLNTEHLNYEEDRAVFGYAIETINLINTANWANRFYENSKSCMKIKTGILYNAIDAVLLQVPFMDAQLKEYYEVTQDLEVFYSTILKFKEIDVYVPYEAEFILLGLNYNEQRKLGKIEKDNLHENYGTIYSDVRFNKISIDDFISKAKKIIENCKENK